jgi:predicted oxidoreductase
MKRIKIGRGELEASAISLGCMRMDTLGPKEASAVVDASRELGIDFFDHADIYGGGRSEEVFAQAIGMTPAARDRIVLQSKVAIRPGYYDFSKDHILSGVQGILRRLKTEYLDVLLLHRPDTLMEPEEVADAFETLHRAGSVRYFGVSNHNPAQIELLSRYLPHRLIVNQLQLSLTNTGMIDGGLNVNTSFDGAVDRDGSVLEYCRLKDITIQAWSPMLYGWFEGVFLGSAKFEKLNKMIDDLARARGVPAAAVAIGWILRHPARIQPVVGTMSPVHLRDIARACEVELTRKEWYELYMSSGGKTLP